MFFLTYSSTFFVSSPLSNTLSSSFPSSCALLSSVWWTFNSILCDQSIRLIGIVGTRIGVGGLCLHTNSCVCVCVCQCVKLEVKFSSQPSQCQLYKHHEQKITFSNPPKKVMWLVTHHLRWSTVWCLCGSMGVKIDLSQQMQQQKWKWLLVKYDLPFDRCANLHSYTLKAAFFLHI